MPDISLTDFVDFAIKAPTSQFVKVRESVNRAAYKPQFDFWKPLREAMLNLHQSGKSLDDVLSGLNDPKKIRRYPQAVKSYKKFVAKQKTVSWFKPPPSVWTYEGLNVRVNPELGLEIDGRRYAIKLYFKDEKPTTQRLKIVFELMRIALKLDETLLPRCSTSRRAN